MRTFEAQGTEQLETVDRENNAGCSLSNEYVSTVCMALYRLRALVQKNIAHFVQRQSNEY